MLRLRPLSSICLRNFSFRCLFFSSSCKRNVFLPSTEPPAPKKVHFTFSVHGETWQDDYRWMSNVKDPDLTRYLDQENAYAEAFMVDTVNLQRKLVAEMRSRMPPEISTHPERWGLRLYYQYVPEGKEYPILCRRLDNRDGWVNKVLHYVKGRTGEEVLLDWNEIAQQFGYVHIGTCRVSPDHNFLAYTLDTTGNESFFLQIKDLRNGRNVQRSNIQGVVSLAWAQDSSTLLYTICDKTQRPFRVFCTRVGSDTSDALLFTESDLSYCVDITTTKDGKFITVNSNSRTSSEVYVMDASSPRDKLQVVRKRESGVRYFLEHHFGYFYILTNAPLEKRDLGGSYYLARCRAADLPILEWQDIILPGGDVIFEDMDMFNGHLVLCLQEGGSSSMCSIEMPIVMNGKHCMNIEDLNPWYFPLPSGLHSVTPGSNHDFKTHLYRVVLSSPVMPDIVVDYDMLKRKIKVVHQEAVLGISSKITPGANLEENLTLKELSDAYCCVKREVISHDGVNVPLTILYSREAWQNGQSPGLLLGYGAYGEVLDKGWQADHLSLLDRGWAIAYADVRGGGGQGLLWHQAGTGFNKINSMHDFFACGTYLVHEGYVHKSRLCAMGYSAGGLLVSACLNMYPDLFCAVILKVPFLDVCNTLLDPKLPLTVMDYEEFGDPQEKNQFISIRSYSPYENILSGICYPSVLVTASFHDSRVGVWEAAKWVAKIREKTCPECCRAVILKTNMNGGHFGEGGRYSQCEEMAFAYAYLIKVVGLLHEETSQRFHI
ncbi:uncharacterized protein [Aristolochia californica]|uniref:uncharacterized protein n=1 Tax=Aristolochia californica TaxID=171875 RepID=UPI0035D8B20A